MPGRYFSDKDRELFEHFSKELVGDLKAGDDGIISQTIQLFKVSVYDTEINMYGEADTGKQYKPGVDLACLIAHEDIEFNTDEFGPDQQQNATFSFIRQELIDSDIRPELGDLIGWNYAFFEISSINENKLIGGQYTNNYDVVCTAFLTRLSNTNMERIRSL